MDKNSPPRHYTGPGPGGCWSTADLLALLMYRSKQALYVDAERGHIALPTPPRWWLGRVPLYAPDQIPALIRQRQSRLPLGEIIDPAHVQQVVDVQRLVWQTPPESARDLEKRIGSE